MDDIQTIDVETIYTRKDLELTLQALSPLTPDPKPGFLISGTRAELARLQLSDRSTFHGIRCEITDDPTVKKDPIARIDRGVQSNFGINNRDTDINSVL